MTVRNCPFCSSPVELIFYKSANYGRVFHKKKNELLNTYELENNCKCILKNAELVAHSSQELLEKWNGAFSC